MIKRDKNGNILPWQCPRCGKSTTTYPAISRADNETEICSMCGIDEALADCGKHLKEE